MSCIMQACGCITDLIAVGSICSLQRDIVPGLGVVLTRVVSSAGWLLLGSHTGSWQVLRPEALPPPGAQVAALPPSALQWTVIAGAAVDSLAPIQDQLTVEDATGQALDAIIRSMPLWVSSCSGCG